MLSFIHSSNLSTSYDLNTSISSKPINDLPSLSSFDTFNFIKNDLKFILFDIPKKFNKNPKIKDWQNITSTFCSYSSDFNYAYLTGLISGITVLDCDLDKSNPLNSNLDGIQHFFSICKQFNFNPYDTLCVKSPSNGIHFIFQYISLFHSKNNILFDSFKSNVDIKNNGGCCFSPPSSTFYEQIDYKITCEGSYSFINSNPILSLPNDIIQFIFSSNWYKSSISKSIDSNIHHFHSSHPDIPFIIDTSLSSNISIFIEFLKIIDVTFWDNRDDWRNIIWACLHLQSEFNFNMYNYIINFSKLSSKFYNSNFHYELNNIIRDYNPLKSNPITYNTILRYAQKSNNSLYINIYNLYIQNIINNKMNMFDNTNIHLINIDISNDNVDFKKNFNYWKNELIKLNEHIIVSYLNNWLFYISDNPNIIIIEKYYIKEQYYKIRWKKPTSLEKIKKSYTKHIIHNFYDKYNNKISLNLIDVWFYSDFKNNKLDTYFYPSYNSPHSMNSFLNTFEGFYAELLPNDIYIENKHLINDFLTLLKKLFYNNSIEQTPEKDLVLYNYFIKSIAYKIKYPYNKIQTNYFYTSEGFGKDIIYNHLSIMLGQQYCIEYNSIKQAQKSFNHEREKAIFVRFNEVDKYINYVYDILKDDITSDKKNINQKFKDERIVTDYSSLFIFTNNDIPFKISKYERRIFFIKQLNVFLKDLGSDIEHKLYNISNKHAIFDDAHKLYFDVLFTFFNTEVDLSNFTNNTSLIPMTKYKQDLINLDASSNLDIVNNILSLNLSDFNDKPSLTNKSLSNSFVFYKEFITIYYNKFGIPLNDKEFKSNIKTLLIKYSNYERKKFFINNKHIMDYVFDFYLLHQNLIKI